MCEGAHVGVCQSQVEQQRVSASFQQRSLGRRPMRSPLFQEHSLGGCTVDRVTVAETDGRYRFARIRAILCCCCCESVSLDAAAGVSRHLNVGCAVAVSCNISPAARPGPFS